MSTALGSFSLVASILLTTAVLNAQDPPPAPANPGDSGVVIRQSVQEVLLDVTVRDSHGRIVKNLKPTDLEILEDGVKQDVRAFKLVQGNESAGKGKGAAGNLTASTAPTPGNPLKTVNLICIVFANLDPMTKQYAVNAVKDFLKSAIQPDTWIAVFNLESQLVALQPFTTNRNEVMEAANRAFTGTGADFASVATAIMNVSPNIMTIEVTSTGSGASTSVSASMKVSGGGLNQQAFNGADVAMRVGEYLKASTPSADEAMTALNLK